ncbi:MAG TPA: NAD-dependent epimerase/dehydratase family protein [Bryobacteraceae bacterium]|jgi:nucleoside-diphosphate-sugar epimerase|nr:NAD-dependent epimerase/dehydratase family protein [Bryobacteraceae bacterium]
MRVLILGATGFLGPPLVERLIAGGHQVTIFHRGGARAKDLAVVPRIIGDRNHPDQHSDEFRRLRPDVVVDVLAFTAAQAQSLVDAFRGVAGRLLVLSSGDVYRANDILFRRVEGPIEAAPLWESSALRDRLFPYRGMSIPQAYGINWDDYDKILVERIVLSESSLPATVLRLPMVYGPGDYQGRKRRFAAYLKRMDDGRENDSAGSPHRGMESSVGLYGEYCRSRATCRRERSSGGADLQRLRTRPSRHVELGTRSGGCRRMARANRRSR